ncbi:MAG: VTT domain-containing protein [Nocardioidaceae bacterium]
MPDDLPLVPTLVLLFVVACLRGGATYGLARWARSAAQRHSTWLERPGIARAERAVRRVGAPLVSLSFLTIGIQTAVNASAGALRMPLKVYLPALVVGAAMWATVYATVGLAAVAAVLGRLSPLLLALAVAAAVVVALATVWVRRREGATTSDSTAPDTADSDGR